MKESSHDRLKRLSEGIFRRIERNKIRLSSRELTNTVSDPEFRDISTEEIQYVMSQYSFLDVATMPDKKREVLDELLSKLDQLHFDIVTMYYHHGKSMNQIAEVYNKPGDRTWVSRRLKEAYEVMRKKEKKDG